jgi:hypothetical protein
VTSSSNIQGETAFGRVAQHVLPIVGGIVGGLFGGVGAPVGAAAGSALGNVIAQDTARGSTASSTGDYLGMGNPITGGKSGGSSTKGSGGYTDLTGLGKQLAGYGTNVSNTGMSQFQAGAAGQLTPAQQALSQEELQQANLGTQSTYAALGLGPSTMSQQDQNANALRNEALQAGLSMQNEQLGLEALGQGQSELTSAGSLYEQSNQDYLNALSGAFNAAGGKSGIGSGLSGVGNWISNLFGGAGTGAAAGSTAGQASSDIFGTTALSDLTQASGGLY